MKNSKRTYTSLIKEICKEEGIEVESFSDDWVFRLKKDDKFKHILGYRFELNTGAIDSLCNDKSAASAILISQDVPCVEHYFFLSPGNLFYLNSLGNWEEMVRLLEEHNQKVVCKQNEGTGGTNIYFVDNQISLEKAVQKLFSIGRSLAISPFYEIENEYRVVILDNEILLIYKKVIPYVIGDGVNTMLQLLAKSPNKYNLKELSENIQFYDIPIEGEMVRLNWRHNLGQGATAELVDDEELLNQLSLIAQQTSQVLNIRFASVDIIKTGDELKVLEVNSGVMMEFFSSMNENHYEISKRIYKSAIKKMFE